MSADNPSNAFTFIDTNIWLYAFSQSQDQQKSRQAQMIIRHTQHIALSTQIINEVTLNMARKFHASQNDIRKLIRSLYRKYFIVDFNRTILLHVLIYVLNIVFRFGIAWL